MFHPQASGHSNGIRHKRTCGQAGHLAVPNVGGQHPESLRLRGHEKEHVVSPTSGSAQQRHVLSDSPVSAGPRFDTTGSLVNVHHPTETKEKKYNCLSGGHIRLADQVDKMTDVNRDKAQVRKMKIGPF